MTTATLTIGDYVDLPNKDGKPIVRLVYVGDGMAQVYRRYRNILTNEISDWRPSETPAESNAKPLTQQQTDYMVANRNQ